MWLQKDKIASARLTTSFKGKIVNLKWQKIMDKEIAITKTSSREE